MGHVRVRFYDESGTRLAPWPESHVVPRVGDTVIVFELDPYPQRRTQRLVTAVVIECSGTAAACAVKPVDEKLCRLALA